MVRRFALRRLVGFTIATAIAVALLVVPAQNALAAPTPPPNPTNGQLTGAQAHQDQVAATIGQLSGQIVDAQNQLNGLQADAELAQQKSAFAYTEKLKAQAAAQAARKKNVVANHAVTNARTRFVQYTQASYMTGDPGGATGALLAAHDPDALLDLEAYQQYESANKLDAIGGLQQASVVKSNSAAASRMAAKKSVAAAKKADDANRAAAAAVSNQVAEQAALQDTMSRTQVELDSAKSELATLTNQRAAFNSYIAEQRRLAAIAKAKAEAEARARAAAARAAKLAAQRDAARARKHRSNRNSGGGGGNGGGSSYISRPAYSPPSPGGGSWTAAKARKAVNRAESTLGTPYAWAGGGVSGPSYGACVPSAGAPYDCHVYGYDCSGLVMYGWGQNWDHFAATQYLQAGRVHPSKSNLRPGDLVFFGSPRADIHHVAMYVGNGRIIEAPYSGGNVQYNDLYSYYDYYGATRPLT